MNTNNKHAQRLPNVSIVVIGYNEAENLDATFQAIQEMDYPQNLREVIYVDSGSKDNSVEIAKVYVDKFFVESKHPSPGRNRNRGLIEAKHEIVHFIDGDVAIDKNYLQKIVFLFEQKDVQAITGGIVETGKGPLNMINRLSSDGFNVKEGYTNSTATGATYLKHALLSVNGYDERIIRGEETDLGLRFIDAGYKIWATQQTMGYHKDGFSGVSNYLNRSYVTGKIIFQMSKLDGISEFFTRSKMLGKKHLIKPLLIFALAAISIIYGVFPYFIAFYFAYIIYTSRAVYKRGNPLSIIFLKVALKPLMNLFQEYGYYREATLYFLKLHDKEFYALKKDNIANNE